MTELQEARLLGRAIRERWEVPPDQMRATVERACHLRDYAEKESTQIAAVNAIVAMVNQNQRDEHKFVDAQLQREHNRLDVVADELGIDPSLVEAVTREASGSIDSDAPEVNG